jgi:ABC-type transport system substrate-binding protein
MEALLACGLAGLLGLAVSCSTPEAEEGGDPSPGRPRAGGTLRLLHEAPSSIDPARSDSVYESLPINQIFDGLVAIDPSLNIVPALASTWTISRDGRTYTFHLRSGIEFQDGSPLEASDVAFTFRRLLDPHREMRNAASSYLSVVEGAEDFAAGRRSDLPGVKVLDPHTVAIQLHRPYLSFLEAMAMDGLRIVPEAVIERVGDDAFGRAPVGTGPYRLASWDDRGYRLERNPKYFGGEPYLDAVEVQFQDHVGKDGGARRFLEGELDVFEAPADQLQRVASDPTARIERYHELSLQFLGLVTTAPPLDDVRVRRAVACAIDRERIAKASSETRRLAIGILPPGLTGYSPEPKVFAHDPERARALLAEAGYPGGRGLRPFVLYGSANSASATKTLQWIREDLKAVGIAVETREVGWGELSDRTENHTAPAFLLGWIADLTDPDSFLRTLFESQGSSNYFAFEDESTTALLESGARETNPVLRTRIYRDVERRILDLAPMVPLYYSVGIVALKGNVRGFEVSPMGLSNVNFERVWLDEPPSVR